MNDNRFFSLNGLRSFRNHTPFFVFSKKSLTANFKEYEVTLPMGTEICYSMKANSEKIVLKTLADAGASFEVANKHELSMLKDLFVAPHKIIYGSSIKPASHIKEFVKYGVNRFAFDSETELIKLAKNAPGSKVYVRTLTDDKSDSVFHMNQKFGAPILDSVELLIMAKRLGLKPYGISFNVGSQARNKHAWANGITELITPIQKLQREGIKIKIINLGGGFPHPYKDHDNVASIELISTHIKKALAMLPYSIDLIAEPGRGLVANTHVLIASVIEKIKRTNGHWLHIDVGVYNAFFEAMAFQGSIRYKIEPLLRRPKDKNEKYIVAGPACDDLDVIDSEVLLPKSIKVGDKILIHDIGAYSLTLITPFNGFPKPKVIIQD